MSRSLKIEMLMRGEIASEEKCVKNAVFSQFRAQKYGKLHIRIINLSPNTE